MKKIMIGVLCSLLLAGAPPVAAAQELSLGGQPVGIEVQTAGVLVAGFAEVSGAGESVSPAREAGLQEGDRIVQVGETRVNSAQEFIDAVTRRQGERVSLRLLRGGSEQTVELQPVQAEDGQWMLGLWLRDQSAGIGTLTFYDPDTGIYGALGHSVSDETTGEPLPIRGGQITDAQIVSVQPGSRGAPGELSGCADHAQVLGEIRKNSDKGIYGVAGRALGAGSAAVGVATPGPASILTTLEGRQVRAYSVEISRVYQEQGAQRLLLTVTDPMLRQIAGGIVQGMSGSPIVQDGKLVGAVTHVLVNDPCRGYGIGIRDMLDEAGLAALGLAA
ncbi:MAG: SpoIVB peptidase [Oscillospiraceae bacterium]|nr:SpoIVB peptidase [Oscillospiraceae bacterium]